jgi:hypothetical protein
LNCVFTCVGERAHALCDCGILERKKNLLK